MVVEIVRKVSASLVAGFLTIQSAIYATAVVVDGRLDVRDGEKEAGQTCEKGVDVDTLP